MERRKSVETRESAEEGMLEPGGTLPGPRRRAIYLLPNLLTTGTLFAGFYGIVASIDGNYTPACIAIFVAALLDGMDGRLARLTHTESEFGKQYDSLADMVAFGVAPAIIVYLWGLKALAEYGWAWGKLGWLAAFLYAVAAALRLARFTGASKTADRRFFEGLPSPSAAGLVASMVWLETQLGLDGLPALAISTAITVSAGVLMVSRLAYYSFKELGPRGRISFGYAFVIPLVFVLIAIDPPTVCFIIASIYALSGMAMAVWRRQRRQSGRVRRHGKPTTPSSGTHPGPLAGP
ncbi:MAG: phosphatidylcholine/phosphatidylserine synthase [Gammaproteobacteria bacterium]